MSAYSAAVLAAKPTLYWQLNEAVSSTTVADSSGNALSGTVGSAITLGTQALVGSDARTSATLPGGTYASTKRIAGPQSSLIQPSLAVSVEFVGRLVVAPSVAVNWLTIGQPPAGNTTGIGVAISTTGALGLTLNYGGGTVTSTALTLNAAYHVAFTYDGATIRVYLNGVLNASTAYSAAITAYDGATGLVVGDSYTSRTTEPNVLTQDVAIYAGAVLSPSTIAQHALLAAGYLTTPYEQAVLAASPALFWPLGDAPGSPTVKDYGPNNLPGTVGSALTLGSTALAKNDLTASVAYPGGANAATKTITSASNIAIQPTAAMSVEALISITSLPSALVYLLSNGATANASSVAFSLGLNANGSLVASLNTGAVAATSVTSIITAGSVYHVAVSYNSTTLLIYVNGVQVASSAYTTAIGTYSSIGLCAGDSTTARSSEPVYALQDVAFYTTALSATTIAQHAAISGADLTSVTSTSAAAQISTPYTKAVLTDTPVGYWRLNDPITATAITDLSGNNISGAWQSGLTRRQTGILTSESSETSTLFPSGAYAATKVLTMLTGPIALLQPVNSFSCDFILNVSTLPTTTSIILGNVNAADTTYPYTVYLTSTGVIGAQINSTTTCAVSAAGVIVAGATNHIAVTYNKTNLLIYVNGTQVATYASTAAITGYGSAPFAIGDQYTSRAGEAQYTISDVAFYSQAISAARVLAHYTATLGTGTVSANASAFIVGASVTANASATIASKGTASASASGALATPYYNVIHSAGSILYWQLDELSGTIAGDASGNGYNGTIGSSLSLSATGLVGSDSRTSLSSSGGAYATTKLVSSAQISALQPSAAVSVEFVGRLVALPSTSIFWLSCGNPTTGSGGYTVTINTAGALIFAICAGAYSVTSTALSLGVDYHVVCTFNGSTLAIYLDGVLNSSAAHSGTITGYDNVHGFVIGDTYSGRITSPQVSTQDVALYTTALSAATVLAHAQVAAGYFTTLYEKNVQAASPVLYWPLGDPNKSVVADYSPNNITGSVGSAVTLNTINTSLISNDLTRSASLPGGASGSTKQLTAISTPSAVMPTTALTIECLYETTTYPSSPTALIEVGNGTTNGYALVIDTDGTFLLDGTLFSGIANSSASINMGATNYIAVSYDSVAGIVFYFLNGGHVASATKTGAITYPSSPQFRVGESGAKSTTSPSGFVSDVAIYATALPVSTLQTHSAVAFGQIAQANASAFIQPHVNASASGTVAAKLLTSAGASASVAVHNNANAAASISVPITKYANSTATVITTTHTSAGASMTIIDQINLASAATGRITATVINHATAQAAVASPASQTAGASAYTNTITHTSAGASAFATANLIVKAAAAAAVQTTGIGSAGASARVTDMPIMSAFASAAIAAPGTNSAGAAAVISPLVTTTQSATATAFTNAKLRPYAGGSATVGAAAIQSAQGSAMTTATPVRSAGATAAIIIIDSRTAWASASTGATVTKSAGASGSLITQGTPTANASAQIAVSQLAHATATATIQCTPQLAASATAWVIHRGTTSAGAAGSTSEKLYLSAGASGQIAVVVNNFTTQLGAAASIAGTVQQSLNASADLQATTQLPANAAGTIQAVTTVPATAAASISVTTTTPVNASGVTSAVIVLPINAAGVIAVTVLDIATASGLIEATLTANANASAYVEIITQVSADATAMVLGTGTPSADASAYVQAVFTAVVISAGASATVVVPIVDANASASIAQTVLDSSWASAVTSANAVGLASGAATVQATTTSDANAAGAVQTSAELQADASGTTSQMLMAQIDAAATIMQTVTDMLTASAVISQTDALAVKATGTVQQTTVGDLNAAASVQVTAVQSIDASGVITIDVTMPIAAQGAVQALASAAADAQALITASPIASAGASAAIEAGGLSTLAATGSIAQALIMQTGASATVIAQSNPSANASAFVDAIGIGFASASGQASVSQSALTSAGAAGTVIASSMTVHHGAGASASILAPAPASSLRCFVEYQTVNGEVKTASYSSVAQAQADTGAMNAAAAAGVPIVISGDLVNPNFGLFTVTDSAFADPR